ncbi:molybdenum cofactor guanylyltransferase [Deinococcus puniceus]|uniref:Probable molybdenum cofactor guanylyltransferase n=1 Tax=Deinococcus puniceus TaxID=1182568 RepID=A0A172TC19_9DEIO|nr:molybdenum cofactor guanylyltransferase [Deinococcus puniceus]ANE44605.1 molybdenum cofactor guanylyltransferase [Deinococcus puniceus]
MNDGLNGITGVITGGGKSSRFGSDKALALLEGRPLLHHVAHSLDGCGLRLLVAPPGKYALGGWQPVPDTRPGEGPLAGLEAALGVSLHLRGAGWVAFTGVDLPRLTPDFWLTLAAARTPHALSVQPLDAEGRPQPLAALYHTAVLPHITALLDAGERRLRAAALAERVVTVLGIAPGVLRNVNTPADLLNLQTKQQ